MDQRLYLARMTYFVDRDEYIDEGFEPAPEDVDLLNLVSYLESVHGERCGDILEMMPDGESITIGFFFEHPPGDPDDTERELAIIPLLHDSEGELRPVMIINYEEKQAFLDLAKRLGVEPTVITLKPETHERDQRGRGKSTA